jgi:hypothetical protein
MKSFSQFMFEMKGDFGSNPPKPKEKCYGKKVYYKQIKKKVCAFDTDTGSNGD